MADRPRIQADPAPPVGGRGAPPLDPGAVRRAWRRSGRFGLVCLVAVLTALLPLPWGLVAIPLALAALVLGVVALVATVRARLRATPVVLVSVGIGLMAVLLLLQLVQLVFYPSALAYQECLDRAITDSAVTACEEQFRDGLVSRMLGG